MSPQAALERHGWLLLSDPIRPALAQLVAGEPIRGSWWGHPRGAEIYALANQLEDDPDVLVCRLVERKVTFVHRALWAALLGAATGGERWQVEGLTEAARALLAEVERRPGLHATDKAATKALQERLLVRGWSVHTASGAHATHLEPWSCWAARVQAPRARSSPEGRARIEAAVAPWPRTRLPWTPAARRP